MKRKAVFEEPGGLSLLVLGSPVSDTLQNIINHFTMPSLRESGDWGGYRATELSSLRDFAIAFWGNVFRWQRP